MSRVLTSLFGRLIPTLAGSALPGAMALATAVAVVTVAPAPVQADEFIDRANALYKSIQPDRSSDAVLLPLLAKMQPVPAAVAKPLDAALLPATSASWSEITAWSTAQPQKDVLEGLKKVTEEMDWKKAYGFAQPYGADKTNPDIVNLGLYTELGDPATLAGAEFKFLPALTALFCLTQVEATRLQAEGKPNDALDVLIRAVFFARQLADREFFREKYFGLEMFELGLKRIRDVAYVDLRSESPKLTAEQYRDAIRRLRERDGILGIDRLRLPQADAIAADQLLSRIFDRSGQPNPEMFASTLARIGSKDRPLRIFSESAKWEGIRGLHANQTASATKLSGVFKDWETRWQMDPFAPSLRLSSEYQKLSKTQYAAIDRIVGDISRQFEIRRMLKVEAAGTRSALALAGFRTLNGSFPPSLDATRPTFLRPQDLDLDPLDPRKQSNLRYFVPGTRMAGAGSADTVQMTVFPEILGQKFEQFVIPIDSSQFVLFSVGPDGLPNSARRATQMTRDDNGDYVVWPSTLSLVRQRLTEQGRLK